jgi:hypothetical protein
LPVFSQLKELLSSIDLKRWPFARAALAIIQDALLVSLVLVCSRFVGEVLKWAVPAGWVHQWFEGLKGFGVLVLYVWFFVELLRKLYNASKEYYHGSRPVLVA